MPFPVPIGNHATTSMNQPLTLHPAIAPISGAITAPPDKSITHRGLFFGALNRGLTRLWNPSQAADAQSSLNILRQLGYRITTSDEWWLIDGSNRDAHSADLRFDC